MGEKILIMGNQGIYIVFSCWLVTIDSCFQSSVDIPHIIKSDSSLGSTKALLGLNFKLSKLAILVE
jgi:hypothetical protein